MTSQIIFRKRHRQFRISFNQPPFISEHTTPQPAGGEETAVTPRKKKAMKRGNKGEQISNAMQESQKAKKNLKRARSEGSKWNRRLCVCVCSGNLISQTLQGRQIYIILSHFSLCSSQTQKNGGNSVTLATNSAYVQRGAADGGGRREEEERERQRWGVERLIQVHSVLLNRADGSSRSGVYSLLYAAQKFSSFQASECTFPDPSSSSFFSLLGFFPPVLLSGHVWGLFKHNLFPLASPRGALSSLSTVVFSLLPFFLPPSYLFTAGCLFAHRLFYRGYEWALSLPCSALYRSLLKMFSPTRTHTHTHNHNTHTHTHTHRHPLSLSAGCESVSGAEAPACEHNVCVTYAEIIK